MTKYVAIGYPTTVILDFKVNGELVVPSSANATITNNAGTVLDNWDNETIELVPNATSCALQILAEDNEASLAYEVRYIDVSFLYDGVEYTVNDFYTLRESLHFPLKEEDVLAVIGMAPGEVPEGYVDIFNAFGLVQDDLPNVNLNAILTGGSALLPALINAVKYKAASLLLIGGQNSLMQMEQSDNTLYRRFMEIDFGAIGDQIMTQYRIALNKLQGSQTAIDPVLSQFITGTDAVTGEA